MHTKLPIILTFEIAQHPEPNAHWYTLTGVLSWEDICYRRMDPAMCLKSEIESLKNAIQFLIEKRFDIREVREEHIPYEYKQGSR